MSLKGKPNVIVFLLDTQRTDNIGCYGYDKPTTPNIDNLTEGGVVFEDNISPAIWTLPSIASIMTGVHVHSHGSGARTDKFNGTQPTIAEIISALGYRTMAFYANIFGIASHRGFRGMHMPERNANRIESDCFEVSRDRVQRAIRWIEDNYLNDGKQEPFFIFIQVMDPHLKLFPRSPFKEQFVLPDATDKEIENLDQGHVPILMGERRPTEREYRLLASMYDAETAAADSHVGVLEDFLHDKGILDETMFIVTSDHGEMRGEHTNYNILHDNIADHYSHHLCVYEELIKVPLVIRWPEKFPPGTRICNYTQTHDLFPTLAEIIGFEAPHCQGFSLLSTLGDNPSRTFTLTEYMRSTHQAARLLTRRSDLDPRVYMRSIKAWRAEGMKYIWSSDSCDELYDLTKDEFEQHNLIREKPEIAQKMRLEMERFLMTCPCAMVEDNVRPGACSPEAFERLKAMDWIHGNSMNFV